MISIIIIRFYATQGYNDLNTSLTQITKKYNGTFHNEDCLENLFVKFEYNKKYDITIKTILTRKRQFANQYAILLTCLNRESNCVCQTKKMQIKDIIDYDNVEKAIKSIVENCEAIND